MNALLVSFFSEIDASRYYSSGAAALKNRCRELSIDFVVKELPSHGYMKNCLQKPQFILDQFDSTERSVLWIDADTNMLGDPTPFEQASCDVVAMTGQSWPILASPLLFHRTVKARRFLQEWADLCNRASESGHITLDHDILCRELVMNSWYKDQGISLVAVPLVSFAGIFRMANSSSPEKKEIMSSIDK
jgi:hypothetical protein